MKIFFSMTFRGDIGLGKKLYKAIEALGYQHTSLTFGSDVPNNFFTWGPQEKTNHYSNLLSELHRADIAVIESSIPSITVGQLLQECIDSGIPVLFLVRDKKSYEFLDYRARDNQKILVTEYTESSIIDDLRIGIEYLSEMLSSRFTMIMPADLIRFLDQMTEKTGKNRSDYIRDLLREQMQNLDQE